MSDSVKVSVDSTICIGNGMCTNIAPELFELPDGADVAVVLMTDVSDPALIELAEAAESVCPTLAVRIQR